MHKFLRAVGFSSVTKRKDYELLIQKVVSEATSRAYTSRDDENMLAEFTKEFAPGIGITVCGEYNENNQFYFDYAYPYIHGDVVSTNEDVSIERHSDKESYAGICEESKVGVTLIFFMQNIVSYLRMKNSGLLPVKGTSVTLTALSTEGTIMMPLLKRESDLRRAKKAGSNRARLMEAARNGDQEAIQSLTLDDMDQYTAIAKRIHTEDIFSIVDTCFMPYGVECDHYSIIGEIVQLETIENKMTGEEVYRMQIMCNEIPFDLCINKLDLYGEPEIGRRFKGIIWLQGNVNFP